MKKHILNNLPISDLIPYDNNYLNHDNNMEYIKNSISTFDFTTPIEVDEDMVILAGHGRLEAAKMLGMDTIPYVLQIDGWDDKKKAAYRIANNTTAKDAALIIDNLELELDIIGDDFAMDDFGLDFKALEDEVIEDEAPPIPEIPKTVKGDIYELGNHRVMCGDSTVITDVEKLMDGQKADMVFTDPPYGVDYKGINNDSREGLENLLDMAFNNYILVSKSGASIYCFHSDRCADVFHSVFRKYFHFSSMIIWAKNSITLSQTDYQSKHEPCLYGWMDNGTHSWHSDRKQSSIWNYDKERVSGHTTPKPIGIVTKAIINSSKGDDYILDLFLGSGSTLIACEQTNRKCYGMELDEKYCDVIVQRYVNFTGNTKIKLNGEEIEWTAGKEQG